MLDLQNSPDIHTETLNQQFDAVKNSTTESEECRYGDLTMGTEVLAEFFAGKTALRSNRGISLYRIGSRFDFDIVFFFFRNESGQ